MRWLMLALVACSEISAAPLVQREPTLEVSPVGELCVTKGAIDRHAITQPTVRAVGTGGGDAAQLAFTFRGNSADARALANGSLRRQLGLKLRAQDSCNVVYVMWRLDPKPKLDVSVKHNPGKRSHAECGADGYVKVRATHKPGALPSLVEGAGHTLRAEIVDGELFAWIDGALVWQGRLPEQAAQISGPAGLRTDNLALDALELSAPTGKGVCKRGAVAED
ncbi:MAG: hypothetical protein QM831_36850 [Kofleriaceae bacterium]